MSEPGRDRHERLREDLPALALGALAAEEAAALERHVEGCKSCRADLRRLAQAVDVLPASVEQLSPPPRLRESLLATVRAEAAEAHARPGAAGPEAARPRPRRSWLDALRGAALRPAVGFAAVVLLIAGVAGGYLLRGEGEPEASFVSAKSLGGRAEAVSATLERQGDSATLHVHELPRLHRDEVYEVWLQRAGVMEPASVFVLRGDGTAEAAVPGPLEGAEAVYVTREPRGGSERPTSPALLEAAL